jgi:S-adenosyl methyltransferase
VSDEATVRRQMTEVSLANTRGNFWRIRSREEVSAFFDGLEPVEPGLVDITDWRPDGRDEEQAHRWFAFGGVGRKVA